MAAFALLHLAAPVSAKSALDLSISGVGARPLGMGRAFTAVADDANAVFLNPAGLGGQKDWEVSSMSTKLMGVVDYKMAGVVYPTKYGTIGVGYTSVNTAGGYLTSDKASISSVNVQAISYGSDSLVLSYGQDFGDLLKLANSSLGKISIGASLKAVSNRFEGADGSGSGTGLSAGILLKPNPYLTYGLNFNNATGSITWKSGTKEEMPLTTSVGGAFNFGKGVATLDMEIAKADNYLHGGVEYQPFNNMVTLRAGLDQAPSSQSEKVLNLAGGVGIKMSGIGFDYAYRQDSTLADNATHYFSISFQPEQSTPKTYTTEVKVKPAEDIEILSNPTKNILDYYGDGKQAQANLDKGILSFYD